MKGQGEIIVESKDKVIDHIFEKINSLDKNILENINDKSDISIDNLTKQYKKAIVELYNSFIKDLNDEYKLLIMKKIITEDNNELLFDILIRDLNFNFGDIVLYTINKYSNNYFLGKLDLFKKYIPYLDKIQLDELLIKSIKYNIDEGFINYLLDLRANRNILNKGIKPNVSFFKNNKELFSIPISRTHERSRVLIQYLFEYFGHPEKKIKNVIHITGSNGKGTTSHLLRYILQSNSYKVNVFTCPSIVSYRENYVINNRNITDKKYDALMYKIKDAYDKIIVRDNYKLDIAELNRQLNKPDDCFFSPIVAFVEVLMTLAFSESNADFSIIEVRNGGLNDVTNVFTEEETIATVLTYIQYGMGSNDRQMPLYHKDGTVEFSNRATAYHKAMLGKKNRPMIVANQTDDVLEEIRRVAKDEVGTYTVEYGREWFIENETDESFIFKGFNKEIKVNKSKTLLGDFQTKNIATALATLYTLQEQGKVKIDDDLIQKGIDKTKLVGRLAKITKGSCVDYFHNKNVEIIAGFIKCNKDGVNNFMDILDDNIDNRYTYIIYTARVSKSLREDIMDILYKRLRTIDKDKYKLIIYRTKQDIFEKLKEQLNNNSINYVEKMNLSSALSYVKNDIMNNNIAHNNTVKNNVVITCWITGGGGDSPIIIRIYYINIWR